MIGGIISSGHLAHGPLVDDCYSFETREFLTNSLGIDCTEMKDHSLWSWLNSRCAHVSIMSAVGPPKSNHRCLNLVKGYETRPFVTLDDLRPTMPRAVCVVHAGTSRLKSVLFTSTGYCVIGTALSVIICRTLEYNVILSGAKAGAIVGFILGLARAWSFEYGGMLRG